MAPCLARVILLLLVAMVAAAPLAEENNKGEATVDVGANSDTASRAKRAKEEIVFGNQQNEARLETLKKSGEGLVAPEEPSDRSPEASQTDAENSAAGKELGDDWAQGRPAEVDPRDPGQATGGQEKTDEDESRPRTETDGPPPAGQPQSPQAAGDSTQPGAEQQQQEEDNQVALVPVVEEGAEPEVGAEAANGVLAPQPASEDNTDSQPATQPASEDGTDEQPATQPASEDNTESQPAAQPASEDGTDEQPAPQPASEVNTDSQPAAQPTSEDGTDEQPAAAPTPDEVQDPAVELQPDQEGDADTAKAAAADTEDTGDDAEAVDDADVDDVEKYLTELHEDSESASGLEKEEEEDEESVERELLPTSGDSSVSSSQAAQYDPRLLKYMLVPSSAYNEPAGAANDFGYLYPASYYGVQRRRRSLLRRRRLPHIHRRRSGDQLARAKRTKRDLFDDDLYYNPEEEEQEETAEEKQADLEDLLSFLVALYPALYEDQPAPRDSQYPGYMWYGANYPEEASYPGASEGAGYPEEALEGVPDWEEAYGDSQGGWEEEPRQAVPAWEPTFYPEEMEEPGYYEAPAKRQMLSMVPGERRKRYFYPFAEEPYTHWGAFVPSQEKREYENAYSRLRQLARVLAESPQPAEYLQDYRKK